MQVIRRLSYGMPMKNKFALSDMNAYWPVLAVLMTVVAIEGVIAHVWMHSANARLWIHALWGSLEFVSLMIVLLDTWTLRYAYLEVLEDGVYLQFGMRLKRTVTWDQLANVRFGDGVKAPDPMAHAPWSKEMRQHKQYLLLGQEPNLALTVSGDALPQHWYFRVNDMRELENTLKLMPLTVAGIESVDLVS